MKEKLEELYDKYKSIVYGVAFSILKNKEDSEDIVQIVFLKIFRLEKEKFPTKNTATWIYEVTKNETINFLKKRKEEINIDELYYITSENKELNEIIDRDSFNKIIARLPIKEQEIISLKILARLSFKEISMILNVPMGTVQWRYYKGVHTLSLLLGNLSMSIVMIITFVLRKKQSKQEQIQEDMIDKPEENTEEGTLIKEDTNITESTETVITLAIDAVDIGIFSITSMFFIATIIFFIIFIKYQQKARKKLSK